MTRTTNSLAVLVPVLALALLGGCATVEDDAATDPEPTDTGSPTPTPSTPTRPTVADLKLTPAGLVGSDGTVYLTAGAAVSVTASDPDTGIVVWNKDFCGEGVGAWSAFGAAPSAEAPSFWISYSGAPAEAASARAVHIGDEVVTDQGIRVGSSRSDLEAAYPSGFARTVTGYGSTGYAVDSPQGTLTYEVAPWNPQTGQEAPDTVISIMQLPSGSKPDLVYASDVGGVCQS